MGGALAAGPTLAFCLSAVTSSPVVPPLTGPDKDKASSTGSGVLPECPPKDNGTDALLLCISKRQALLDSGQMTQEQEAADEEAAQHMSELEEQTFMDPATRTLRLHTPRFQEVLADVQKSGFPKIYPLRNGFWAKTCDMSQYNLGYRYTLEVWMRKVILDTPALLVSDVEAADYVYLPHCATGVFMHSSAAHMLQHEAKARRFEAQLVRGRLNQTRTRPEPEEVLTYEGNLAPSSVRFTDRKYLMGTLYSSWLHLPEFQACLKRPTCRFLVVSIYGRHVWREFSSYFGDKAVFLTHAGMSDWLSKQRDESFYDEPPRGGKGAPKEPPVGECRAACAAHCMFEPPAVLREDIVLPWTISFSWTKRSQQKTHRDILAFFSGTSNSCSREALFQLFQADFAKEIESVHNPARGRRRRKDRVLVFPPEIKVRQEDWSELAFRSRLCICPDGDSPNTGRLVEVIMHGCVPLIISNRLQPPLHDLIDWHQVAIFVREDAIPRLPEILRKLSRLPGSQQVDIRKKALGQAAYMLHFSHSGIPTSIFSSLADRTQRLHHRLEEQQRQRY